MGLCYISNEKLTNVESILHIIFYVTFLYIYHFPVRETHQLFLLLPPFLISDKKHFFHKGDLGSFIEHKTSAVPFMD